MKNSDISESVLEKLIDSIPAADAGMFFLYDSRKNILFVKSAVGFSFDIVSQMRIKAGESITGKTFQTNNLHIYQYSDEIMREMADMSSKNRYLFIDAREEWCFPYSIISFPLMDADNQCFGVINLYSFELPAHFGKCDLAIVEAIVNKMPSLTSANTKNLDDERLLSEPGTEDSLDLPRALHRILVVDDEAPIREIL